MRDGVEVFKLQKKDESEEKQVLGKSPKAGQMAVMQSAASRVFTNMYAFLPSLSSCCLIKVRLWGRRRKNEQKTREEILMLMIVPH